MGFKAIMAGVIAAPVLTATIVTSTATVGGQSAALINDPCLSYSEMTNTSGVTASGFNPNPSQQEVAEILYQTALSEGLGQNGALLAVYVGYAETKWHNATGGDGSYANTSRGVFQQLEPWAGKTAWSGLQAPKGVKRGAYFVDANAWGPNGWAENDRRMNPAKATELFLDALRKNLKVKGVSIDEFNAEPLTDEDLLYWSYIVQRYAKDNPDVQANQKSALAPSREMYEKLNTSGVSVTTDAVVNSASRYGGNGALLIGDSLMEGIAGAAPDQDFGGPITKTTEVGISLEETNDAIMGKSLTPKGQNWKGAMDNAPSRVYVSLGTNKPISRVRFEKALTQFMQLAGPNRNVYWDTLAYEPVQWENEVLLEATKKYPNLKLVDFGNEVADHPEWAAGDGLHLNGDGYAAMWKIARTALGGIAGATVVAGGRDACMPSNLLTAGVAQTVVGPDGCPVSAPSGTMEDGSDKIDIATFCAEAVAGAATPQAAAAIKWALTHLGIPYACTKGLPYGSGTWIGFQSGKNYGSQPGARMGPEFYDCSSFVSAAYAETSGIGIEGDSTAQMKKGASKNYESRDLSERMAGDLIVEFTGGGTQGQHVTMYLGRINGQEWIVHTNSCGAVSHVERYSAPASFLNVARPIPATKTEANKVAEKLGISL